MKRTFLLLISIITGSGIFAQKIDWVNAPLNPTGFKYKKEHFNLKGDVYSNGSYVFSKEGYLLYENSLSSKHFIYKDGKLASDTEGQTYEYDSRGYLTKYTFANLGIQSQSYTYNAQGLLTGVSNTMGYNVTYTYDAQGRLIKNNSKDVNVEYSYQKNGDQLLVTEKNLSKTPAVISKLIYKNGVMIGRDDNLYNIKYDESGNQISFNSLLYYSDIENRNNELSVIYTKPTSLFIIDPLHECKFYINGKKVDFIFKKAIQKKDLFVYNPFTEKYYIIKDAFNDDKSGKKQIFSEIFLNSPYAYYYESKTYSALFYKGADLRNSVYLRNLGFVMNNTPFLYIYDKDLDMTFHGESMDLTTQNYRELHQISPNDNIVFFKYNDIYYTFLKGQPALKLHPDYKLEKLNADVIYRNGKNEIVYIFPQAANYVVNKVYAGRKYQPSTDYSQLTKKLPVNQTSNSNTNSTTSTSSNVNKTNSDNPYIGLSTEAASFMAVYRLTPKNIEISMVKLHNKWVDEGYSIEKINLTYAGLFKELYAKDKDAAFNFILGIIPSYFTPNKDKILPQLTAEQRNYVQVRAQDIMRKRDASKNK